MCDSPRSLTFLRQHWSVSHLSSAFNSATWTLHGINLGACSTLMLSHSTELLINAWDGWRYSHISLSNTIIALLAPGGWYLSCPVCLLIESRRTARRTFSLKMQSPIDVRRALLWGEESRGKCLYFPGPLFKFTHYQSSLVFQVLFWNIRIYGIRLGLRDTCLPILFSNLLFLRAPILFVSFWISWVYNLVIHVTWKKK